jgi:hypothetical protein
VLVLQAALLIGGWLLGGMAYLAVSDLHRLVPHSIRDEPKLSWPALIAASSCGAVVAALAVVSNGRRRSGRRAMPR